MLLVHPVMVSKLCYDILILKYKIIIGFLALGNLTFELSFVIICSTKSFHLASR